MAVTWEVAGEQRRGPSWAQLVDQAAMQVGAQEPALLRMRGSDLQILEYVKAKKDGMQPLINWLHKSMDPPESALTSSLIHQALSKLEHCNLFYTTNYDDFLERSLRAFGSEVVTVSSEHELSQSLHEKTQVVKFHGDFNRPDAMVLTESDYGRRMRFEDALDYKLRSDVLGKVLLFIGYSFNDANVAYLFRRLNDVFGKLPQSFVGKRAYIAYVNPSDFERRLFHARNIEVISIDGRARETDIANLLREMTG
ncbi:SIR2 family protein [Sulfitobacter dubius]|uniref:SIR2 family protein n=1 Tax=Sulfitobacter dubius TaxID=218673 RepID=UPI0022AEBB60|nr:SIR2 family protein [Sulfitobacter dubius]MCZ4367455.1 SIR2 family protein [Sulfitobacter dubius]